MIRYMFFRRRHISAAASTSFCRRMALGVACSLLTPGMLLVACARSAPNVELQAELVELGRTDQDIRRQAAAYAKRLPGSLERLRAVLEEQKKVDAENLARLEAIIAEYGWPGRQLVGEKAGGAALIVLQHADVEKQRQYLPLLEAGAARGDVPPLHLARLVDNIRAGEGRDQLYGTRVQTDADGRPTVYPVEDPERLEERRKAAGLAPIEEQLAGMEAEIGMPIGRGNLVSEAP